MLPQLDHQLMIQRTARRQSSVNQLPVWFLQERCGVEQQHIGPYLEGRGGPPIMASNDRQGTFLKETQQWIIEEEQVSLYSQDFLLLASRECWLLSMTNKT